MHERLKYQLGKKIIHIKIIENKKIQDYHKIKKIKNLKKVVKIKIIFDKLN